MSYPIVLVAQFLPKVLLIAMMILKVPVVLYRLENGGTLSKLDTFGGVTEKPQSA